LNCWCMRPRGQVLRLSPLIPIPLGAYSYIYGTSRLEALPFAAATALGSLKPYLLDSYLGVFSKQLIDGDSMDSTKDLLLLVGLGALVLVGVFATDLAGETWDQVQLEVKADEKARKEAGVETVEPDAGWDGGRLGAMGDWLWERLPADRREESAAAWSRTSEFLDVRWAPAVRRVLAKRREREAKEAQGDEQQRNSQGNQIERLLASLARPAEPDAEPGAAGQSGGDQATAAGSAQSPAAEGRVSATAFFLGPDEASESELAERRRAAAWSLEGAQPLRPLLSQLYFSFALLSACRKRWEAYPDDRETLEQQIVEGREALEGSS